MQGESVYTSWLGTKRYICDENSRMSTDKVSAYGPTPCPEHPLDPVSGLGSLGLSRLVR